MEKAHVVEIHLIFISIKSKTRLKLKVQFFLACLLVLLFYVGRLSFCLVENLALDLILDLAISGAESIGKKVAVGFSR